MTFSGSEVNGPFHANLQPDMHDVPHLPLVRLFAGDDGDIQPGDLSCNHDSVENAAEQHETLSALQL